MDINSKKIIWLLLDSGQTLSEISQKTYISRDKLVQLKEETILVKDLATKQAQRLTAYAHELIEMNYYKDYRWLITREKEIEFYNFKNIVKTKKEDRLLMQVFVTPELRNYEFIKDVSEQDHVLYDELKDAKEEAFRSVGIRLEELSIRDKKRSILYQEVF